ncbi:unnamed protein product [Agarophyton chilense]
MSDPDTYGVVISTPPATHPELIKMAANPGMPIFSENPLEIDSQTLRAIISHVENSGVRFMTGFMRRWNSANVSVREGVY